MKQGSKGLQSFNIFCWTCQGVAESHFPRQTEYFKTLCMLKVLGCRLHGRRGMSLYLFFSFLCSSLFRFSHLFFSLGRCSSRCVLFR